MAYDDYVELKTELRLPFKQKSKVKCPSVSIILSSCVYIALSVAENAKASVKHAELKLICLTQAELYVDVSQSFMQM